MSKKEKKVKEKKVKEKKEKVPMAIETKQTVFKSVTALVCTIAICVTSSTAVGKYSEAIKAAGTANNNGGSAVVADDTAAPVDDTAVGGDVVADDTAAPVDDTAAPADDATADDTAAPADDTSANAGTDTTQAAAGKTNAAAKDPTQYSKAEIVNYYNKCLKESYAKKLKAKKTETITIVLDSSSAGSIVTNFVNNTILPKYAGTTDYDRDFTNGIHGEQKLTEYASPYSLTADGAKSAKIVKSGSNYVITINVVAEKSTLQTPPKYNTMCSHPLDLATVDISPATVTKADFTYPGTTLTATVDANGKVLSTAIKQPLSGTGEGKLGITISATLHGSLDQKVTYTYL